MQALTGRFDDHHAELARMLLDQIDALTAQIDPLTTRIDDLLAAIPAAQPVDAATPTARPPGTAADADIRPTRALTALDRLDEIPGIGADSPPRRSSPRSGWT